MPLRLQASALSSYQSFTLSANFLPQFQHKMNFLAFSAFMIIAAIQGALALRCHLCSPDLSEVIPIAEQSNSTGLSFCASPNQSLNCSQRLDPFFGTKMDSCVIGKITLNTSLPIGDIDIYYLNCATMSKCSTLKNRTCPLLESELGGTPKFDLKSCDFTCCHGDLCNAPSISPSSPAASTAEYPVGTGTTAKSLVKSSVPPTSARFGVLILMALTAVNF